MTEQSKADFRTAAMKIRNRIRGRNAKSAKICSRLLAHSNLQSASNILIYVSMRSEVQTHRLIEQLLANATKNVYVPYCYGDVLRVFPLTEWTQLTRKTFGVLEPKDECLDDRYEVDTGVIELTIVPGVAFDENLNRVGYGKGFYDKLLTNTVPNSHRIATAFAKQVFDEVPTASYDIPMHEIVTEVGIIS